MLHETLSGCSLFAPLEGCQWPSKCCVRLCSMRGWVADMSDSGLTSCQMAGLSVLHYAVDGGHPDIVSMLLLTGQGPWLASTHSLPPPAVNSPATTTEPSSSTAASNEHAGDSASAVPSNGAAMTGTAAFTPLHLAARRGHAHLLPQLLRCGLDSRAVDGRGRTVLHHAALGAGEAASAAPPPPMRDVALGAGGSQPLEPPGSPAAANSARAAGGSHSSLCVPGSDLLCKTMYRYSRLIYQLGCMTLSNSHVPATASLCLGWTVLLGSVYNPNAPLQAQRRRQRR